MDCPTCNDDGFDSIHSLAGHHGAAHGEPMPKTEDVDIPEDKEWEDLTPRQRWYYRNHEERLKENAEARDKYRDEIKEWFQDYKDDLECQQCDEKRNPALDFHHTDDNKTAKVSTLVHNIRSVERIKEEIDKCIVLCANCHRVQQREQGSYTT